ncbi:MAG: ribonuclease P protein subunit [Candidatus Heimdallarchaeota archaeon]|nr:ribonuclease P protein subunit [Candidatus Heimdallarchaeota archaeon]MCK4876633.1 ribonuclease P protein subunit [Candidatus Heimdallarchaeota archaeon]
MNLRTRKKDRISEVWSHLAATLCGLKLTIKESSSKELEGIGGLILEETAQMIKLETEEKIIWIPKKNQFFEIELKNGLKYLVDGKILLGKPEARIKRKIPNW